MISIAKAKYELPRDKKRKRIILSIGKYRFHLDRKESKMMVKKLSKLLS